MEGGDGDAPVACGEGRGELPGPHVAAPRESDVRRQQAQPPPAAYPATDPAATGVAAERTGRCPEGLVQREQVNTTSNNTAPPRCTAALLLLLLLLMLLLLLLTATAAADPQAKGRVRDDAAARGTRRQARPPTASPPSAKRPAAATSGCSGGIVTAGVVLGVGGGSAGGGCGAEPGVRLEGCHGEGDAVAHARARAVGHRRRYGPAVPVARGDDAWPAVIAVVVVVVVVVVDVVVVVVVVTVVVAMLGVLVFRKRQGVEGSAGSSMRQACGKHAHKQGKQGRQAWVAAAALSFSFSFSPLLNNTYPSPLLNNTSPSPSS